MIETILTADAVKAALAGFTDPRAARAWRNRSPVTHGDYWRLALALGDGRLAPSLYVACGQFADAAGNFTPAAFADNAFAIIASLTARYSRDLPASLPEKGLSRGEYETRRARKPRNTPNGI